MARDDKIPPPIESNGMAAAKLLDFFKSQSAKSARSPHSNEGHESDQYTQPRRSQRIKSHKDHNPEVNTPITTHTRERVPTPRLDHDGDVVLDDSNESEPDAEDRSDKSDEDDWSHSGSDSDAYSEGKRSRKVKKKSAHENEMDPFGYARYGYMKYTPDQRRGRVKRYREKRKRNNPPHKYVCRQRFAASRKRINGRFVTKEVEKTLSESKRKYPRKTPRKRVMERLKPQIVKRIEQHHSTALAQHRNLHDKEAKLAIAHSHAATNAHLNSNLFNIAHTYCRVKNPADAETNLDLVIAANATSNATVSTIRGQQVEPEAPLLMQPQLGTQSSGGHVQSSEQPGTQAKQVADQAISQLDNVTLQASMNALQHLSFNGLPTHTIPSFQSDATNFHPNSPVPLRITLPANGSPRVAVSPSVQNTGLQQCCETQTLQMSSPSSQYSQQCTPTYASSPVCFSSSTPSPHCDANTSLPTLVQTQPNTPEILFTTQNLVSSPSQTVTRPTLNFVGQNKSVNMPLGQRSLTTQTPGNEMVGFQSPNATYSQLQEQASVQNQIIQQPSQMATSPTNNMRAHHVPQNIHQAPQQSTLQINANNCMNTVINYIQTDYMSPRSPQATLTVKPEVQQHLRHEKQNMDSDIMYNTRDFSVTQPFLSKMSVDPSFLSAPRAVTQSQNNMGHFDISSNPIVQMMSLPSEQSPSAPASQIKQIKEHVTSTQPLNNSYIFGTQFITPQWSQNSGVLNMPHQQMNPGTEGAPQAATEALMHVPPIQG